MSRVTRKHLLLHARKQRHISATQLISIFVFSAQILAPLYFLYHKEYVLLRRAISLKVNYEKVKFSNCVFGISLVIMSGHTCKSFEKNINDVQNKGNREINTAQHNYSKKRNLIVYKLKGLKGKFLCILQTVVYHQRM